MNDKPTIKVTPLEAFPKQFMAGLQIHEFILRRKIQRGKNTSAAIRKQWRVECSCGNEITVPEFYLRRQPNPKTHCGCKLKTIKTIHNETYRIWLMMHVRTEDPDHVSYNDYGGRGIKVCSEWNKASPDGKGFERFLEFVGPRPSKEYSIDRINVDLGYQPFQQDGVTRQVKWSTAKEQRANQRPKG
jgi:hypothetical protein